MKKVKEFANKNPLIVVVVLLGAGALVATAFSKVRRFLSPAASKLPGADTTASA